ncbi:DUF5412 family protein [Paenibacillus sepulcri]|uniref:DUF5412 domain-containing protein n=1 Tax=Paenibacillus sepulcri TaxID=359917 RepID=A0ABS7C8C2_9BACL|nr:DUF5412 domain-containing protein [Paenibacillus sepulcri]
MKNRQSKYNLVSFCLSLFCSLTTAYSVYSNVRDSWLIAPPNYMILLLSILALILAIKGFKDKSSWFARMRSWLNVLLSVALSFVLLIALSFTTIFSGAKVLLKTAHSPDNHYTIDFYYTDAGAMGTFGILGELNGPLWFKKKIYSERRVDQADIEWANNHIILINNHELDLKEGGTLFIFDGL